MHFQGKEERALVFDSCQMEGSTSKSQIIEQIEKGAESDEEKLLCNIKFWRSLNKLDDNAKLTANQLEIHRSRAIDCLTRIATHYDSLNQHRWALACRFLVLYSYESGYEILDYCTVKFNNILFIY